MELSTFFPYRLAVLAEQVSQCMAQVYGTRFELSRDEWRVLATLYEHSQIKTSELIAHTTLDKMQASRAIASLEAAGRIGREADPRDRRNHLVSLLPPGRTLVRKIIPLVQAREAFLLAGLDEQERAMLLPALDKLTERARQLVNQG